MCLPGKGLVGGYLKDVHEISTNFRNKRDKDLVFFDRARKLFADANRLPAGRHCSCKCRSRLRYTYDQRYPLC
jgi:hypothetical protein